MQASDRSIVVALLARGGRYLVSRRRPGTHLEGAWEFPGGKIDAGESPLEALGREVEEEVGLRFRKAVLFHRQEYAYADRALTLEYYLCADVEGEATAREGQELRWVDVVELQRLETPPANAAVIRLLEDGTRV